MDSLHNVNCYVDVYELVDKNRTIAIIHYLPQYEQTKQSYVYSNS